MRDDSFVRIKPSAFVRAIVRSSRTVMRPTNIAGGFARNDAVVKLPQYWSNFIHIGAKSARPSAPTPTGVKAIGLSATPFELHSRSSTIISGVKPALNQRVPITERPATWAVKDLGSLMTIGGCRPLMKHELKKGSVVLSKALIFRPYNVFAVDSFEPANGEMTPSHLLKMLDKRVVHGSATQHAGGSRRPRAARL
jgi:hypothetical protein